MQEELTRLDQRSQRFLIFFNLGWMSVSIVSLTFSAIGAAADHPAYLHDWHGLVILLLMLCIPLLFGSLIIRGYKNHEPLKGWRDTNPDSHWPPPLLHSLPYWGSLYLIVTLLCIFDQNFVWSYFIVLGMTFSLFQRRRMLALAFLIFLSYSNTLGLLAWPPTKISWGSLLGNGIAFTSLTIVCIIIQHLIGERYERSRLLWQLANANEELAAAHRQLAETAAQEQELAVLRERTRLAREMHDTLGHALVLISVKLEAAQRLRERDPQRCEQELEETKEIVRESMKELRASIANLRSPVLEREPACRALSRYAREMAQRTGLRVSYDLHPNIEGLPEPVEETLWRVGQEALANIEKHARAQNVLLHISRQDGQIFLKIADDGVGLPAELCQHTTGRPDHYASPTGHYGLSGMLERVKNAHGQLVIGPNGSQGTSVEVTLPLVEAPLPTSSNPLDIRSSELVS
jgi:signal transduction histidine kinase